MSRGILKKQIYKEESSNSQSRKVMRKEWTREEDRRLKAAIQKHGTNWKPVAETMGDRNPSQCAQRWKRIKPESVYNICIERKEIEKGGPKKKMNNS